MTELFLKIVNMSITASILVVLVLLLRLLLKKAPKWVNVLLWGLVAVRLVLPFGYESGLSLLPKTEWIKEQKMEESELYILSVPDTIKTEPLPADITVTVAYAEYPLVEIHKTPHVSVVLSWVWLSGMVLMVGYLVVSYAAIRRRVGASVHFRDNIYTSVSVDSPFVLGVIRPRIYLPENMDAVSMSYVIDHEKAHIARRDHWWKPLGFLLLTLHWFNPLIWLGYILLCRDIEMACDERVVKGYDQNQRADYSEALLACSVKGEGKNRRMISVCPVAFGEVGVRKRIGSVLSYKKPGFWIVLLALIASAVFAVCFLTNPKEEGAEETEHGQTAETTSAETSTEEMEETFYFCKTYDSIDTFHLYIKPDGTFTYTESVISSKLGMGTWVREGDILILTEDTENPKRVNRLLVDGDDLVFIEEGSSNFLYRRLADGDRFVGYKVRELISSTISDYIVIGEIRNMTLDDVLALSEKGYELTWDDLIQFNSTETGSGLYIHVYPIDDNFELWVGGTSTKGKPMYARLTPVKDTESAIDIRDGGVEEFIAAYGRSAALENVILDALKQHYADTEPTGLYNAVSYHLLKEDHVSGTPLFGSTEHTERVICYLVVYHEKYSMTNGQPTPVYTTGYPEGSLVPTILTFRIDEENGYILEEYTEYPDGSYTPEESANIFPAEIMEEVLMKEQYLPELKERCKAEAFAYYNMLGE